jgi:hypothetical protein
MALPLKTAHTLILSFTMALVFIPSSCFAGIITDGNSTMTIDPTNGVYFWQLDPSGSTHGWEAWFYFRIDGDTREYELPAAQNSSFAGNQAIFTWTNVLGRGFDLEATLTLHEVSPNVVDYLIQTTLTNTSGNPLNIQFFYELDHDIEPDYANNYANEISPGVVEVSSIASPDVFQIAASAPDMFKVGNPNSVLRGPLGDLFVDNFDNTGLPFGPGDFGIGYQWPLNIPAGQSASLSATISGNGNAPVGQSVPTLSEWGLILFVLSLLSLGTIAIRQRRRIRYYG